MLSKCWYISEPQKLRDTRLQVINPEKYFLSVTQNTRSDLIQHSDWATNTPSVCVCVCVCGRLFPIMHFSICLPLSMHVCVFSAASSQVPPARGQHSRLWQELRSDRSGRNPCTQLLQGTAPPYMTSNTLCTLKYADAAFCFSSCCCCAATVGLNRNRSWKMTLLNTVWGQIAWALLASLSYT